MLLCCEDNCWRKTVGKKKFRCLKTNWKKISKLLLSPLRAMLFFSSMKDLIEKLLQHQWKMHCFTWCLSCKFLVARAFISQTERNELSCISVCSSLLTFLFVVTRISQYKNARMRLYLKILHYTKQTVLSLFSCCGRLWMQSCWFYYRDCQNL